MLTAQPQWRAPRGAPAQTAATPTCALSAPYYKYTSLVQAGGPQPGARGRAATDACTQPDTTCRPKRCAMQPSTHRRAHTGCRITMSQSDKKYPLTACSHEQTVTNHLRSVCPRRGSRRDGTCIHNLAPKPHAQSDLPQYLSGSHFAHVNAQSCRHLSLITPHPAHFDDLICRCRWHCSACPC